MSSAKFENVCPHLNKVKGRYLDEKHRNMINCDGNIECTLFTSCRRTRSRGTTQYHQQVWCNSWTGQLETVAVGFLRCIGPLWLQGHFDTAMWGPDIDFKTETLDTCIEKLEVDKRLLTVMQKLSSDTDLIYHEQLSNKNNTVTWVNDGSRKI